MATGALAYAYSPQMRTETMNYMTAETRLGEDNLTPGFITHLEKFYKKAGAKDRAKCLELLTALNIQEELNSKLQPCRSQQPPRSKTPGPNWKPLSRAPTPAISDTPRVKFVPAPPLRPRTAMALAGRRINKDPYQTTYEREFVGMTGPAATENRPTTSRGIMPASYKLSGATTYSTEFAKKPVNKTEPTRAGSSSGNRRNNPHPKEAFMVWRFGQNQLPENPDGTKWAAGLTDDIMDKVVRGKCRSTYQNDYIGLNQGQKMEPSEVLSDMSEDSRRNVPYTLDSSMRQSYQMPRQHPIFKGNTSRFGCNKHKAVAATGTVPDTSASQMHIKTRTTYEREFSDNVPANATDLRDIGRRLGAETLQKYMDTTNDNEKETLTAMLKAPNDSRSGSRSSSRHARIIPEATQIYSYKPEDFKPDWLSSWTGPM